MDTNDGGRRRGRGADLSSIDRGSSNRSVGGLGASSVPLNTSRDVLLEGWLKKRGTRMTSMWSERYFVLKGDQLLYYLKQGDAEPRGRYMLDRTCVLSDIKQHTSTYDKKKVQYAFRLLWPEAVELLEDKDGTTREASTSVVDNPPHTGRRSDAGLGSGPHTPQTPVNHDSDRSLPRSGSERDTDSRSTSTKIIRSAVNTTGGITSSQAMTRRGSHSSMLGSGSGRSSSGTLATGAAMVGLAVGGVVVGALTAGVGLVAPMVIVGITAAAGSGATVYGVSSTGAKTRQISLVLSSDVKETAEEWHEALQAQIRWCRALPSWQLMSMVGLDRRTGPSMRKGAMTTRPTAATKMDDVDRWTRSNARWKMTIFNGLRIYELDLDHLPPEKTKGRPPCRKMQVPVRATPLETFITLVSIPSRTVNGLVNSTRIIEHIDDQSDVIHVSLRPIFLAPTWTAPRDFCLVRYWRYDDDGTYIVCYDSTQHRACPPVHDYVRGDMHAVFTISPKKGVKNVEYDDTPECLLTYILQVDPRGWIWQKYGYVDRFVTELLLHALDVRDLLETDRFMAVHVDTSDDKAGGKEVKSDDAAGNHSSTLRTYNPTLPAEMYAEVDATTFVVRGPTYNSDKLKVPSDSAPFRLLAVDLFDLQEPIDNIAAHPKNRMQAAIKKGDCPPFVWVVQLQFPGVERHFGYVAYFAPDDMSVFEEDSPLARVIKPFFLGDDNAYRDNRFKLIPRIVEGNWVVRKSVGSTPAILGTKLKQNYYKGQHYFELDVNIASSSVAAGVVRLAAGYAKTLVVDLALVIQGEEPQELPERVLACWRIKFMDLACAKPIE